jgi:hypothetical protein
MTVSIQQPETPGRELPAPPPAHLEEPSGAVDLQTWAAHAAPGARCVYHRGHLAEDRHPITSRLGEAARRQLDGTADLALAMAPTGQVLLVQRRHGDGDYSYLAIKATAPRRRGAGPGSGPNKGDR